MDNKRLFFLTKNWSRHGKFSGYECIINFLNTPYQLARRIFIPYRIIKYFANKTQLKNYQSITVVRELNLLLQFFKTKTIHVLYGDMDFYYLHYVKRFPFNLRPTILTATFHHPPSELDKRLGYNRKQVLGALDKIVVMGPNQIPFFKPYTEAAIRFIPHGIHLDYFKPNPDAIKQNQFLILGISHRDHERNIAIIEAFPKDLICRFIVVMPPQYAKLYDSLDQVDLITDQITDNQLLRYYQESKGLLLSLKDCTASNSILEALACGCPLITNRVGAVEAYIPDDSGIPVFETLDIQGSIAYMVELLENETMVKTIRIKQRELAKKYDWKLIAKATEDFILQ